MTKDTTQVRSSTSLFTRLGICSVAFSFVACAHRLSDEALIKNYVQAHPRDARHYITLKPARISLALYKDLIGIPYVAAAAYAQTIKESFGTNDIACLIADRLVEIERKEARRCSEEIATLEREAVGGILCEYETTNEIGFLILKDGAVVRRTSVLVR